MIRIFKNIRRQDLIFVVLSIAFVVLQVWLDLKLPDYMSEITILIETEGSEMSDVLTAGGKMLLCAFGSLVTSVVVAIFASRIASNFSATLRLKLFNKVQSFSMEEIGKFSTASLITRSTNDITQVQMLIVMGLQVMVKAPVMAVWAICKISNKSRQWTMSTAAAVVIMLIVVIFCLVFALPKFKKLQVLTDNLNMITRENLTGINVVRAYNAEEYQKDKFEKANDELTKTNLFTMRTMALLMPVIQLVMNGLSLAIYWIGAVLIENVDMPADPLDQAGLMAAVNEKVTLFSDMVVFSSYAMQVVMSFMMLVAIFIMLPRASVAAKRILEVLDTNVTIRDGKIDKIPEDLHGEIEFKDVSFRYPGADDDVLQNISFTAHQGETIAFIGSTGCGKSTLINLVPRFYDATKGQVLVDGVDVKEYTQQALHNIIGYVSQKAILFSGDIKENIAYGDNGCGEPDMEQIERAAKVAQAGEFIDKKESGYSSHVAQGGTNFSGGQKQRLSIARAVCRRPEILIFDDSFSALDYKTDRILRKALAEECKNSTKLIVAQRIGTIRDADKIIVLDQGNVAGMGTHDELMKNCEVYQQIAYSQLSREELA